MDKSEPSFEALGQMARLLENSGFGVEWPENWDMNDPRCDKCPAPAKWLRKNHERHRLFDLFCDEHAQTEPRFDEAGQPHNLDGWRTIDQAKDQSYADIIMRFNGGHFIESDLRRALLRAQPGPWIRQRWMPMRFERHTFDWAMQHGCLVGEGSLIAVHVPAEVEKLTHWL